MINGSDFGLLVGLTSQNRDTSLSYGSTTDSIPEGSNNLYFTSLRARSVYTVQLPLLYNQSSGELALQAGSSSLNGYISSSDWTTFNNKQSAYTNLTSIGGLANASGWLKNNGSGTFLYSTPTKSDVGLGNVPNTDCTNPANITQSSSYRFVTDTDKTTWNSKADSFTGYTGSVTVVTGVNFALMTTTTKTITINNGIVVGVE